METEVRDRLSRKEARLRKKLETGDSSARTKGRLVAVLIERGRSAEALDVAVDAFSTNDSINSELYRLVGQILGEGDLAQNFGDFMTRLAPDAPLFALAKFCEQFGDLDLQPPAASVILDRCAGEFASGSRQLLVRSTLAHACGDSEASRTYIERALIAAGSHERRLLKVIQISSALGVQDVHEAALKRHGQATGPRGDQSRGGYDIVSRDGSMLGFSTNSQEGVVIFRSFGRFWEASHPLVASLKARNVASVTVVDVERLAYAHGFGDHFPDVHASTDALGTLMAEQSSVTRWHTLGFSVGGWAALRYGAALGVDSATVFSGLSYLPLEQDDPDPRGRAVRRRGANYEFRTGTDAREDLLRAPNMKVRAIISASSSIDRMHAERINDLENVSMLKVAGESHAFWKAWGDSEWGECLDELGIGVPRD